MGVLIPAYHQWYWLGIEAAQWPKFTSIDKSIPSPSRLTYQHWADGQPNTNQACAAVAASLAYGGAWGWLDADCNWKGAVVCKTLSEWPSTDAHAPDSYAGMWWPRRARAAWDGLQC